MRLNRRYRRNIKENLSFYISAIVLTIVSMLLFFVMNIAGQGIHDFGVEFFREHNVEDAQFTTYNPISEEEQKALAEKYGVELEPQYYVNVDEGAYTARIFKRNTVINTAEITAGQEISSDDEILISEGYAVGQGIEIGDSISVGGKEYRVCGYFQRPDYLYMLEELDDNYKNNTSFFLAYVSDGDFLRFSSPNCLYMVVYHEGDQEGFRREVAERYIARSYVSAEDNQRISLVEEQARLFLLCSWVLLVTVPLITVALISIIIGRKVKNEQKMIGTLSALGYRKSALKLHYVVMGVIPGLFGSVLSVTAVAVTAQPYGEMGLADYEPMHIAFKMSPFAAVMAILVPTLLYALAAMRATGKLLKRDTVLLLNGNADGKRRMRRLWVDRPMKVRRKFGYRALIANPGRTFVVFLGIFLGTFIVMFGYMMIDAIEGLPAAYEEQMGDLEYEYVLNTFLSGDCEEGEPLLLAAYEHEGIKFSLMGIDEAAVMLNLETKDGRADISKGWYMSNLLASICGVEEGDTFTFVNRITMEEYSVTVEGIIDTDMQKFLVGSKEEAGKIIGVDAGLYNAVMTKEEAAIDNSIVASVIAKSSIEDQMTTLINEMNAIIYALIVIGGIICIAAVYVSVNMLMEENRHNISMLKVLGYRDKEINKMVLNANHILVPFGIAAGIAADYFTMKWYFAAFAETMGMIIPTVVKPLSVVLTIVIVGACYFISLLLIRRKTLGVDMVESLKDNRE